MSRYRIGMVRVVGSGWVTAVQVKPGSIVQVGLQPSPATRLPSSHSSSGVLMPSPHFAVHAPPPHGGSNVQLAEQPSYGMRFPSSHSSPGSVVPLPQMAATSVVDVVLVVVVVV